MVRKDGTPRFMLIDFDWSGGHRFIGEVRHPNNDKIRPRPRRYNVQARILAVVGKMLNLSIFINPSTPVEII